MRPAAATAGSHTRCRQFASRMGSPFGLLKSTSSGFLPEAWAINASISDRGIGTSRDWCVFGVDQIRCPLTSETDSDTRSRRRIRSTERTRSAAHSPNLSPHRPSTKLLSDAPPRNAEPGSCCRRRIDREQLAAAGGRLARRHLHLPPCNATFRRAMRLMGLYTPTTIARPDENQINVSVRARGRPSVCAWPSARYFQQWQRFGRPVIGLGGWVGDLVEDLVGESLEGHVVDP